MLLRMRWGSAIADCSLGTARLDVVNVALMPERIAWRNLGR